MAKKILLADDSITIQKVISITFASEDYDLIIVGDGDAAIKKAKEEKPDLVMADVAMPGKTGYEVCESLKNDPELGNIPVILLAGTFEPLNKEEAKKVKADDSIIKPFESQELIDKVRELLSKADSARIKPEEPVPARPREAKLEVSEDVWEAGDFLGFTEDFDEGTGVKKDLPDLDFLEGGGLFEDAGKDLGGPEFIDLELQEDEVKPKAEPMPEPKADEEKPAFSEFVEPSAKEQEFKAEPFEVEPFELETFRAEPFKPEPAKSDVFEIEPEPSKGGRFGFDETSVWEAPEKEAPKTEEPGEPVFEEPVFGEAAEKPAQLEDNELIETDLLEVPHEAISEEGHESADVLRPEVFERERFTAPEPGVASVVEAVTGSVADRVAKGIAGLEGISLPKEEVEAIVGKVAREVIEEIAWEVIPELAEELIKAEIVKIREAISKIR